MIEVHHLNYNTVKCILLDCKFMNHFVEIRLRFDVKEYFCRSVAKKQIKFLCGAHCVLMLLNKNKSRVGVGNRLSN